MNRERFQRVAEVFEQAIALEGAARETFVAEACGDDAGLRAEVESLLARHHPGEPGRLEVAQRTLLGDPVAPGVPATIGHYQVRRVIASGAMGTVYEAVQDDPQRVVALKVLRPGLASSTMLTRFRHEAEFLGRLNHPNIARIYDASTHTVAGTAGGAEEDADDEVAQPWFAMEYVDGRRLTDHARAEELDTAARIELVLKLCDALQHAHDQGIVHRDLKPENILVDGRGEPRILDFGIARATDADLRLTTMATSPGVLLGTLAYMSPEQVACEGPVDARSDVYALGVLLFELLTDRLPHDVRGKPLHEAVRCLERDEPSSLGQVDRRLRGDLETIVAKALEREPDRRYPSAVALAADLRHFLRDEPIVARPASTLYQLRKFARRNPALVGGVATSFVLLVAGILAVSWQLRITQEQMAHSQALNSFALGTFALLSPADAVDPLRPPLEGVALPATETLLQDAEYLLDTHLGAWPVTRADLHLRFGLTYWGLSRFEKAWEHIEDAVRLRTEHLGPDHLETYRARLWRHQVRMRTGQDVLGSLPEVLDIAEGLARLEDAPRRDVLTARLLAADTLIIRGDVARGTEWTRDVFERVQAELPGDRLEYSAGQQLAFALSRIRRHEEAEAVLWPLLHRGRQQLDERDLLRRTLPARLAAVLNRLGRHEEALPLATESVELARLHRDTPLTLFDMRATNELATALTGLGRRLEAVELLRRRVDTCRAHDEDHPYVLWAVAQHSRALRVSGLVHEAHEVACRELETTAVVDDAHVAVLRSATAEALVALGRVAEAAWHWRLAIERMDRHGQVGIAHEYRRKLARNLERAGSLDEAEAVWRERLARAEAGKPRNPRAVGEARRNVAKFLVEYGQPDDLEEAAALAGAAAEILDGLPGLGWHRRDARALRDRALAGLGRAPETEPEAGPQSEPLLVETSR